jgi:hypothetical protein
VSAVGQCSNCLQTLGKRECSGTVQQLFADLKNVCDSASSKRYTALVQLVTPMKLVVLINVCINKTYSKTRWPVGTYLSDAFRIENCLKEGHFLSSLVFHFCLEYAMRSVQLNREGQTLNGTRQLPVRAYDILI